MITLSKPTKIKLLEAIRTGLFDVEQFPELQTELAKFSIELIDKSSDVDRDLYPEGKLLNELRNENSDN